MWQHFDYYGPHMSPFGLFNWFLPLVIVIGLIAVALKGYSLWHAARRNEKWWFVALLVVNTAGILEIIYILFILKKFGPLDRPPKKEKVEGPAEAKE